MTSFSNPGDHVLVLPWPAPSPTAAPAEAQDDLAAVAELITSLNREATIRWDNTPNPGSRTTADGLSAHIAEPANPPGSDRIGHGDLVLTTVRPSECTTHLAERVALLAARILRAGGLLVVHTHCDWSDGTLLDPTGALVSAGQNADLLYLQHIVALHVPIPDGRTASLPDDGHIRPPRARTMPTDTPSGHPQPHRRIHSDVLVFTQPHDHRLDSPSPATDQPLEEGSR